MAKTTIVIEQNIGLDETEYIAYLSDDHSIQARDENAYMAVAKLFLHNQEKLEIEVVRRDKTPFPYPG